MHFDNELNDFIIDKNFSGAIIIKNKSNIIFSNAYGYENITYSIPNTINTKFRIASLSKLFTSVSVFKLISEGKLTLETKIKEYLNLDHRFAEITVYELLTHTSGMTDYYNKNSATGWNEFCSKYPIYEFRTLRDYIKVINANVAILEKKYNYSCAGYIILGLLIEKISEVNFQQYVYINIINRFNLFSTSYYETDDISVPCAEGYYNHNGTIKRNVYKILPVSTSNGGMLSTVSDMIYFFEKLWNGEVEWIANIKEFFLPQVFEDVDRFGYKVMYGFGMEFLIDSHTRNIIRIGIAGEEIGVSCRLYFYPQKQIIFCIMSNYTLAASDVGWEIHKLMGLKEYII